MNRRWKKCFQCMLLLSVLLLIGQSTFAQLRLPQLSQRASVSQTVGLTDVTITYHRPLVKGRKIYGDLVPYNKVWRTGANNATIIQFSDDVTIEGQKLPAGSYSLHTIPTPTEWTIIFNKVADQWGSYNYDPAQDALRIKVKPQTGEHQEALTFSFPSVTPDSTQVVMHWERLKVPFTIQVDPISKALANSRAAVAAAKPDDWRTPLQAASFFFQNNSHLDEAMQWVEKSISIREHHNNLSLKARMLAKAGKTQEAIALGEKAVQLGKASQQPVDTSATEKFIAELKARKM